MIIESPQSFVVREECQKAARRAVSVAPWGKRPAGRPSARPQLQGKIRLAAGGPQGPWFLAVDYTSVIAELGLPAARSPGPGSAQYTFDSLGGLYAALGRVYELGVSLPYAPLREFEARVEGLPQTTEAEPLVVQRIGQEIFLARLMDYWQGSCPLTGISDPARLRASHIVRWSECESDAERLDVHNGFLPSVLWDAAFDRALVTFDDEGKPRFSPSLSEPAQAELRWHSPISLTDEHRRRLGRHRERARTPS
jgi:hypothetical protein